MELDSTKDKEKANNEEFKSIFESLLSNNDIIFKSQQRGEMEPSSSEKMLIIEQLFNKNKTNFLLKFGKHLTYGELEHFRQFTKIDKDPEHYEENKIVLNDLQNNLSHGKKMEIKNRRYMALQKLIEEQSYFSEVEMMKRNPLLYDQLVGQYLSEKERQERDFVNNENTTLVKILLESIDRDEMENCRKQQQEQEGQIMDSDEECSNDEDSKNIENNGCPTTSLWGEYETHSKQRPKKNRKLTTITAAERLLLRKEFETTMYQNFLDGKDKEFFDYSTVDTNSSFNNDEEMNHDAEEKYFDSEDVEDTEMKVENGAKTESSEDELDVYMKALNQHQTVCDLAKDIKRNL
ncbi:hypothetical protein GWI33_013665 [Rhynchophorus ferrugineus]|uniref:CCD97-like C-terminal domain-containing protein n=1 Tax=Rhynchophorus ferrugineus TaxID=354439 RepID=A0A834I607_RHYFE|nr:hypothetical protein GWI33_013665 [Rhynchophorus ferrugineus]